MKLITGSLCWVLCSWFWFNVLGSGTRTRNQAPRTRDPWALAGILAFVATIGIAPAVSAQDTLPDGPGKEETLRLCSQCHEAQKAASVKLTRKGWTETIDRMKAFGAQGTDQEFQAILEYLSNYFKGDLDQALDMNSAEAIDLESVLQLLRKESAAFLQFRSKRGPFASLADLKDLDPVILKKIESKKERIVFLTVESKK